MGHMDASKSTVVLRERINQFVELFELRCNLRMDDRQRNIAHQNECNY